MITEEHQQKDGMQGRLFGSKLSIKQIFLFFQNVWECSLIPFMLNIPPFSSIFLLKISKRVQRQREQQQHHTFRAIGCHGIVVDV